MGLDEAKHGRLDAAEREVVALWLILTLSPTLFVCFDLRARHSYRMWISTLRQCFDDRTAWITKRQEFCDFVERFSGSVVEGMADVAIAPGSGGGASHDVQM